MTGAVPFESPPVGPGSTPASEEANAGDRNLVREAETLLETAPAELLEGAASLTPESEAWLRSAGQCCESLRFRGAGQQALELAQAGQRRTRRLRLEEALAACMCGRIEVAEEVMRHDVQVERLLGPVAQALSGRRVVLPRVQKSPCTKQLHTAAKAVAELAQGRERVARKTATAVADPLFQRSLEIASEVSTKTTNNVPEASDRRAVAFLTSDACRARPALGAALIEDALGAGRLVNLGYDELKAALPKDLWEHLVRVQVSRHANSGARVSALMGALDAERLSASDRAAYWLWRGFSELADNPERATRSLSLGAEADTVEALRGRYQAALESLRREEPNKASGERLMAAAERLLQALDRHSAQQEAAILALDATVHLFGDVRRYLPASRLEALRARAIKLCPALGEDASRAGDLLACAEARALLGAEPVRALELAEQVLARDQAQTEAWWIKIRAGKSLQDAQVDDWILAACENTGDPGFRRQSERVRLARGQLQPLESFSKSELTPGRLVLESLRYLMITGPSPKAWLDAWDRTEPFTEALKEVELGSFCAGMMAYGLTRFDVETCAQLLTKALGRCGVRPDAVYPVVVLLAREDGLPLDVPNRLQRIAESMTSDAASAPGLVTLVAALRLCDRSDLAQRVMERTAGQLPMSIVTLCRRQLDLEVPQHLAPDLLLRAAKRKLHPEVDLYDLLLGDADLETLAMGTETDSDMACDYDLVDDEPFSDEEEHQLNEEIDQLGWIAKAIRLDKEALKALPAERKDAFLDCLNEIDPDTEGAIAAARKLAEDFDVVKRTMLPKATAPKSAKQKNRQKRERRQRRKGKGGRR